MKKKKEKKNKFQADFENNDLDSLNDFDIPEYATKKLTRDERRMIRATKRKGIDRSKLDPYDQSDLAAAKRYAKKNKFKVIFVTFTIILLIAVLTVIAVALISRLQAAPSTDNYEVCVGDDEPYELSYKDANKLGQFYFDLRIIAKYLGSELKVSGSGGRIKFTCTDDTYVRFVNDSATATVNGEAVKVGGKVKITPSTDKEDGKCLVPFKFIEKLFSYKADGNSIGMVARVNEKNKVTIHRMS